MLFGPSAGQHARRGVNGDHPALGPHPIGQPSLESEGTAAAAQFQHPHPRFDPGPVEEAPSHGPALRPDLRRQLLIVIKETELGYVQQRCPLLEVSGVFQGLADFLVGLMSLFGKGDQTLPVFEQYLIISLQYSDQQLVGDPIVDPWPVPFAQQEFALRDLSIVGQGVHVIVSGYRSVEQEQDAESMFFSKAFHSGKSIEGYLFIDQRVASPLVGDQHGGCRRCFVQGLLRKLIRHRQGSEGSRNLFFRPIEDGKVLRFLVQVLKHHGVEPVAGVKPGQ